MLKNNDIQTRGIILSRFSSGEGSARVMLFTEELGLISALAKSAREERSKLRPHLIVGTFGTFNVVRGKEIWRIVGAVHTHSAYFSFSGRSEAQAGAARVLSLLRQLIVGEEKDKKLFIAVWHFLHALIHIDQSLIPHAERLVVLQILGALGYVGKDALPSHHHYSYSNEDLMALTSLERHIHEAIKKGFVASGLI